MEYQEHMTHTGSKGEFIAAALDQMPETLTDVQQDQISGIIGDVYDAVAKHDGLTLCACEQNVVHNQKSGECFVMGFRFEIHHHDDMERFISAAAGEVIDSMRSN
jgi:hypothetical protein